MFENMTKKEAIDYCYKHENQFKSDMYKINEDGEEQFECLITILETGNIEPKDLPNYGMDYGA